MKYSNYPQHTKSKPSIIRAVWLRIKRFFVSLTLKPQDRQPIICQHQANQIQQADLMQIATNHGLQHEDIGIKQVLYGIDKASLNQHKLLIRKGLIQRSAQLRANHPVKGRNENLPNPYYQLAGSDYYLYHRTHLVPFRYCLDELWTTVWAFSRLNNGTRPQLGQIISPQDISQRHPQVMRLIWQAHGRNLEDPKLGNQTLCLADFEQASDHIINQHPNHRYSYFGQASFVNNNTENIFIELYDQTSHDVIFSVVFNNRPW